ncbi:hypothetical protein F5883DRAFT_563867 [Diaporthe sp. PMI_573]|nr:hypothetical protein F5883DRAFT_563867 [Diaporthaceae sp. PMI_573]
MMSRKDCCVGLDGDGPLLRLPNSASILSLLPMRSGLLGDSGSEAVVVELLVVNHACSLYAAWRSASSAWVAVGHVRDVGDVGDVVSKAKGPNDSPVSCATLRRDLVRLVSSSSSSCSSSPSSSLYVSSKLTCAAKSAGVSVATRRDRRRPLLGETGGSSSLSPVPSRSTGDTATSRIRSPGGSGDVGLQGETLLLSSSSASSSSRVGRSRVDTTTTTAPCALRRAFRLCLYSCTVSRLVTFLPS